MPHDVERLKPIVERLKQSGCRVSIFMDPDPAAMRHVPSTGADRVELYTESYADAFARRNGFDAVLRRFVDSARAAADAGLGVNAGHDLNLQNLPPFVSAIGPETLLEVSIGHALVGDALHFGMADAVRRYLAALAG
jgi:pyridoxine 5-phosphate synthase